MTSERFIRNIFILLILLLFPLHAFAENMDPGNNGFQYAWGENVGWLNLEPGGDGGLGVQVENNALQATSGVRTSAGLI